MRLSSLVGFATASDNQRIEPFVRRGARLGFYGEGDPTPTQLVEDADESLFRRTMYSEHHVLKQFLPYVNNRHYSLRPRRHNFMLATKTDERNFITRQLFTDIY